MRLHEYEAKALLRRHGLPLPESVHLMNAATPPPLSFPVVVKAQVLTGGRGKAGAVKVAQNALELQQAIVQLFTAKVKGEPVNSVLIESFVKTKTELYVSFLYDTRTRNPVLLASAKGGVDIEQNAESITRVPIDPLVGLQDWQCRLALGTHANPQLTAVLMKLWQCFSQEDCTLLEINPLTIAGDGTLTCVGAMIELDDFALFRHKGRSYAPRTTAIGREPTEREKMVKMLNDADHHGTIKYLELDGDIGFLASGGGASLTCMDKLIEAGGKPANYSEFSGNPSEQKIAALIDAVLSKPLKGLWVIGGVANFTAVDTTMKVMVDVLKKHKPKIPIVVRRGGPKEKEGLQILREAAAQEGWRVEAHGREIPLTQTAQRMVELAYGNTH
jgi:succinyl-CoA synthetase beta subunit